ncbi:oxidoreductase [Amycolatopsis sp. NPDC059027]|uniref:oxidoreductase n=1 Tax=unclassified Amycolatopsis TaxID=2618356 RepID=UPI00366FBBED
MSTDNLLAPLDPFAGVPDKRYEVKAADLLKPGTGGLLRWRRQATNAPIVQVEDAYITGTFDLRAANLNFLFRFERCRFEHPPDVREANLLGLVFRKCWLPGLKARNMRSRNDVRLIRSVVEVEDDDNELDETTIQRGDDRERGKPNAAVNLTDAVIEGSVVLTRTTISHPRGKAIQADRLVVTGALLAYRMVAHGEVRIPGLRAGGNVNFSGATLNNKDGFALNGNGLHIGGSLLCEVDNYGPPSQRQRFSANGILYLPSATVDSDIVFREARLVANQTGPIVVDAWKSNDPYLDPRPAFVADRLKVDGNLELSDGLQAVGTLRMVNARIGGSLRLAGAEIKVKRGEHAPFYDRALHLDGSTIGGDIEATSLRVPSGQLRLSDITVGGNLLAWNSMLLHPDRDVFSARRAKIAGNLQLTDATLEGTLRLQGVEVGGSVNLFGTKLSEPGKRSTSSFSLDVRTARIGRDLMLTEDKDRQFLAEGGVNLDGAQIARRVDLSGAQLGSLPEHGIALDASDVTADEFTLAPKEPPAGRLVLRRAHCGTLADNDELWDATGGIELEDFRYDALKNKIALDDDKALDKRIALLRKAMGGYRPGPYDQLAAMLRASGNEEHASTVALRKQQFRYEALARGFKVFGPGVRLWSWLQRSMVGYGYRPVRALGWLLALLVLGSLWFGFGTDSCVNEHSSDPTTQVLAKGPRCVVNNQDTGIQWNPVIYTADLLVPIVDFGNKSRWYMHGVDKWVAAGFTASGWILASTVAAGVSRMLRRDN